VVSGFIYLVRAAACVLLGVFGSILAFGGIGVARGWMLFVMGGACIGAAFLSWPRRANAWRGDPPTDRQLSYARTLGISVPRGATKGEVSDMISESTGE
jgi:hypothetical protein